MFYCSTPNLGLNRSLGVLCTWVKLLTDLQILGCELHKNAFGGRAPPELGGGRYSAPKDTLAGIRGEDGEEGKGWK